jgi:hypothetical protein
LTYYEPQADVNVTYGPIDDVLESPDEIEVNPSVTAMPRSRPPGLEPLEQLARYAFPVTSTEKSVAADRKKKAAAKPTGKKAAKKKAAKKAAARKAVKKKAVRRKAAKRSARRR